MQYQPMTRETALQYILKPNMKVYTVRKATDRNHVLSTWSTFNAASEEALRLWVYEKIEAYICIEP
jgi:hypothetical protein